MRHSFLLFLLLSIFVSACNRDEKCRENGGMEMSFYDDDYNSKRSTTLYDCKGNLVSFRQYPSLCKDCWFQILYDEEGKPDTLIGTPWMHTIYNKKVNKFNKGDTLDIIVEVANPHQLESKFSITDNDSNTHFTALDSYELKWLEEWDSAFTIRGKFYHYQTIINDTAEYFEMQNTFSYKGKPWITSKRYQPLSIVYEKDTVNAEPTPTEQEI